MTDWIVITGWDKFQHYKDRRPAWIKDYPDQIDRDDYLELSPTARALLQDLRRLYALNDGVVRLQGAQTRLRMKLRRAHWKELSDAGFIEVRASKPLALARTRVRSREVKRKEETPPTPPQNGGAPKLSQKQVRKYTGCRATRGSHGFGFVRDPLGVDKPPPDWPYERPSKEEVGAALAATSHGGGEQPPEGA